MDKRTGEIKQYMDIPKDQKVDFSQPFELGDVVDFKGVQCEIIRIKPVTGVVWLKFKKPGFTIKGSDDKRKKVVSPPAEAPPLSSDAIRCKEHNKNIRWCDDCLDALIETAAEGGS